MRILHLYKDYFPVLGGIENHVHVLAEAQAAAGHEVTVLVAAPEGPTRITREEGVKVIRAHRWATVASTPLSGAFFRQVASLHADIAHLHFPHPPGEVANWLLRPARRTVITYHADVVRQKGLLRLYAPLMRRILRRADRILVTSPFYAEGSPHLAPLRERCSVVPLGVDLDRFSTTTPRRRESARAAFGLPAEAPLAVFVGRLRYYKGLDMVLKALPHMPELHLLVAGSGPYLEPWKALARELGVAPRAHFAGDVSDELLPDTYATGDLFVLPATSRAEAFGTVLLEAMASELPVVSTELGTGTSWVNRDGETGLVVPPSQPEALAKAMSYLMENPDKRLAMGRAARERVAACFSRKAMVENVESVYREVLAPCGAHNV